MLLRFVDCLFVVSLSNVPSLLYVARCLLIVVVVVVVVGVGVVVVVVVC